MSDARHAADDASFRASLLRQGGGAVAVLAASALVFWGIGALGGGPLVPTVDGGEVAAPDDEAAEEPEDEAPAPEPTPEPDVPEGEDATDEADDAAPDEGGEGDEAPSDADDEPAEEPEDDGPDEGAGDAAIDPASVTVQVLDGYKVDGGAAAGQVADQLDGAGYRIVARNQAINYTATTVLFNPGHEAAAQQIARDLGGAEVRAQPGNLSTQVSVHVVVGADRA